MQENINNGAGSPVNEKPDKSDHSEGTGKRRLSSAEIADVAREIGEPAAESLGLYLWDCEYSKEGREWVLSYRIDSEEGVTLDDCEAFYNAVAPLLDRADPIDGSYELSVTSPGIERNIRTPEHYEACVGVKIQVKLYAAVGGRKIIVGLLTSYDEERKTIVLNDGSSDIELPLDKISRANVYYDFEEDLKK